MKLTMLEKLWKTDGFSERKRISEFHYGIFPLQVFDYNFWKKLRDKLLRQTKKSTGLKRWNKLNKKASDKKWMECNIRHTNNSQKTKWIKKPLQKKYLGTILEFNTER